MSEEQATAEVIFSGTEEQQAHLESVYHMLDESKRGIFVNALLDSIRLLESKLEAANERVKRVEECQRDHQREGEELQRGVQEYKAQCDKQVEERVKEFKQQRLAKMELDFAAYKRTAKAAAQGAVANHKAEADFLKARIATLTAELAAEQLLRAEEAAEAKRVTKSRKKGGGARLPLSCANQSG